jgi:NAD(P)-dependent dehydrogenase (short-subunit alcohol dehydrogenase family)
MTPRLAGKVAFITGAARGQGRAHAVRLAEEGADIIAVDLAGPLPADAPYESATPADLEETRHQVEQLDRRIIAAQADVRDLGALRRIVDEGVETLGRLDIVIANAGICIPAAWNATTPEIFDATMDISTQKACGTP